jgi:AraC-like DNA-binding protein
MFGLAGECQLFVGECSQLDITALAARARQLVSRIPPPEGPLERTLLRGLLLEIALHAGELLHNRLHGRGAGDECRFVAATLCERRWRDCERPATELFLEWAQDCVAALERSHDVVRAHRLSEFINTHYALSLNVAEVARELECDPDRLRRLCKEGFGVSIREYHRRTRVMTALRMVKTTPLKIEAIALMVGYRSKKNFYRAVRSVTGLTPTQFRSSSLVLAADPTYPLRER